MVSMSSAALAAAVRHVPGAGQAAGMLQVGDMPESSRPLLTRSHMAFLAEQALHRLEDSTTTYAIYGGVAVLVLAGIGGAAFAMTRKKADKSVEEGKDAEAVAAPVEAAAPAAELKPNAEKPVTMDAEKLMKTVARRAVQLVGPKLSKAYKAKTVLESHAYGFPIKARAFLAGEIYSTVAGLLRELEAEEAMLLLGLGTGNVSVPPMSVLLAGLLSPVILSVSFFVHLAQVIVVLIPVTAMCAWALYHDMSAGTLMGCGVPGLWLWMWIMGVLAAVLAVAHTASMVMLSNGKASIRAKAEEMKGDLVEAVGDGELDINEIRKLFLVSSALLQHALYVEDNMRRSIWREIIGLCTCAWFLLSVWNFFIVLLWTFVPGVVAFHASAAELAGDDYCGAWASVLTARITCVLALLFVVFNMISMTQYISDKLVTSESFHKGMLDSAKKFDSSSIGIPVMQVMVKAFLLRGNTETLASHIGQAKATTSALEEEYDRLLSQKESLEGRIEIHRQEASQLKKEAGIEEEPEESWTDQAKEAGTQAVEEAKAQAAALEQLTRQELEALLNKVMEAAQQVRNSEALKVAMEHAELAKEQAKLAAAAAQDPEALKAMAAKAQQAAQEGLAQAQDAASSGLAQAQQAGEQLASSEAVQRARQQASEWTPDMPSYQR